MASESEGVRLPPAPDFLTGGGEMAALMRSLDLAAITPFGWLPPELCEANRPCVRCRTKWNRPEHANPRHKDS